MGLPRLIGKALNTRTIYLYRLDSMAGLVLWIPVFTGKTIPGVFGQPQDGITFLVVFSLLPEDKVPCISTGGVEGCRPEAGSTSRCECREWQTIPIYFFFHWFNISTKSEPNQNLCILVVFLETCYYWLIAIFFFITKTWLYTGRPATGHCFAIIEL